MYKVARRGEFKIEEQRLEKRELKRSQIPTRYARVYMYKKNRRMN